MPNGCRHYLFTFVIKSFPRQTFINSCIMLLRLYRVPLKKGNPSFLVHYSIIKNYYLLNVHIIGKLTFSSFIWHHKHDQWITHDRLHTIWSGTDRNPIVQNKWMAATLGSLWFLTCASFALNNCQCAKYKLSLLSHAWPFHRDYGVIWKKRKWAFQWCVHSWKNNS